MAKLLTGTRIYGTGTVDTQLFVSGAIATSSTNTGALQVVGGAGIGGSLFVGGTVTATSFVGSFSGSVTGSASSVANAVTFNSGGTGDASGTTFNGSVARTISYNTLGAMPTSGGTFTGPVTFNQPVTFGGTATYILSTNTFYTDNIIEMHTPPAGVTAPWFVDDGKDIGFRFHYYANSTDTNAALVLDNASKELHWYSAGAESLAGDFSTGTYGTFRTGAIRAVVGTQNQANTSTGALTVFGGVGVSGGAFFGGIVTATNFSGSLSGGTAMSVVYQSAANTTAYLAAGSAGQILQTNGTGSAPTWVSVTGLTAGTATTSTQVNTVLQTANASYYPTFVDANNASATGELVYTTSSFVINPSTGNVGLGVATPLAKLHVVGAESRFGGVSSGYISVYDNSGRVGYIQANGGTDLRIAAEGATTPMTFYANGSERVRFDTAGNVGVGTASPASIFHVRNGSLFPQGKRGGASSAFFFENATVADLYLELANTVTNYSGVLFSRAGAGNYGLVNYNNATDNMVFYTSGTVKATIASTGAIAFGSSQTAYGTSGQILQSNGNTSPTWVNPSGLSAGSVANALTINNSGSGVASGSTFNGSSAVTISYNTVGAPMASYLTDAGLTRQGNSIFSADTRNTNYTPGERASGLYADFKANATTGLTDGGTYHGILTFRPYGASLTDFTGGNAQQIATTDNNNLWHRMSSSTSTWGTWYKIIDTGNTGTAYVNRAVIADSAAGGSAQVNTVAQTASASYFLTFVDTNNASAAAESVYTTSTFSINPATGFVNHSTGGIVVGDAAAGATTLQSDYTFPLIVQRSGNSGKGAIVMRGSDSIGTAIEHGRTNAALDWGTYQAFFVHDNNTSDALLSLKEKMRINGTGVGIGTSSPSAKLTINNSGSTSAAFYADIGNPGSSITLFEHTGASTPVPFRFRKSGYSGASPNYGLFYLHMNDGTVGNGSNLYFNLNNAAGTEIEYAGLGAIIRSNTTGSEQGDLTFYVVSGGTGRTERMRITSAGAIAFSGSTNYGSSGQILQSNGNAAPTWVNASGITSGATSLTSTQVGFGSGSNLLTGSANLTYASSILNVSYQNTFNATTPGFGTYGLHFNGQATNDYATGITFSAGSATAGNANAGIYSQGSGSYGTKLYFATTDSYATGSKTRMMIDAVGNVGIGTITPGTPLAFTDSLGAKIQFNGNNANGYQIGLASSVNGGDAMMKITAGLTGAGEIGFYNTTNLRLLINNAGNIGIGVSGPSHKVDVSAPTTYSYAQGSYSTGATIGLRAASTTANDYTGVRFTNSNGSREAFFGVVQGPTAAVGDFVFQTYSAFTTSYGERMRVQHNGNVVIGANGNTSTNKFEVQGLSGQLFSVSDTFTGTIFAASDVSGIPSIEVLDTGLVKFAQYNGSVAISTGTAVSGSALSVYGIVSTIGSASEIRGAGEITAYYSSDERLKENISVISNPIEIVKQIRGVYFDWTAEHIKNRGGEDGYFVRKHDIGVIAQEVEKVLPEVVATRDDGFKAVKYEKLVALLIEAVKEQQSTIDTLVSEIKIIKDQINK